MAYPHYRSPGALRSTNQAFDSRYDGIICNHHHEKNNNKHCGHVMTLFHDIYNIRYHIKPSKVECTLCGIHLVSDQMKKKAWCCTTGCTYYHRGWAIICNVCIERRRNLGSYTVVHGLFS